MSTHCTVIEHMRGQGLDPFEVMQDGRPAWMHFEDRAQEIARKRGLVPVVTDRVAWSEAHGCLTRVIEWQPDQDQEGNQP